MRRGGAGRLRGARSAAWCNDAIGDDAGPWIAYDIPMSSARMELSPHGPPSPGAAPERPDPRLAEAPCRLLVAVDADPGSERLVRLAPAVASARHMPWFVAFIHAGRTLDDGRRQQLQRTLDLARQQGAEVVSAAGSDRVATLLRVARQEGAACIMLGKPEGGTWWSQAGWRFRMDRLVRRSGDIEVHVVQTGRQVVAAPWSLLRRAVPLWPEFGWALIILSVVTLLGSGIAHTLGYAAVPLIYLLTVVLASLFLSRWPIMALAIGSAMAWWYFYMPARFSLSITHSVDALILALFAAVALLSGHLTSRLRARERESVAGERRAHVLYDLLRSLTGSHEMGGPGLAQAVSKIERVFHTRATLLRPTADGQALDWLPIGQLVGTDDERLVAEQAWRQRRWAGRHTLVSPQAQATYLPLLAGGQAWGAMAIQIHSADARDVLQRELLESIASLVAAMLERAQALQLAEDARVAMASQKMQRALLDNFSHEIKTPVSVLAGTVQSLLGRSPAAENGAELLAAATDAVARLDRVVRHLVDMAQLERGLLQPALEWCEASDLVEEWVECKRAGMGGHRLVVQLPPESVYVRVDTTLLNTTLDNLLDNALRVSPPQAEIELAVRMADRQVSISMLDHGPGIPAGDVEKLFGRFQRGSGVRSGGLGLGLAIARQFVELMGGSVTAVSPPAGGACFTVTLPGQRDLPQMAEVPS